MPAARVKVVALSQLALLFISAECALTSRPSHTPVLVRESPTPAFDPEAQMSNFYHAWSAFCPPSNLFAWDCEYCFHNPGFKVVDVLEDKTTGVQGYIGYNALNSTIILAFRGSSNIPNWIVDFAFPLSHFDGLPSDVKVHWGFYQAFSRLKMQSRAAVARIIEGDCPNCTAIISTGHSLGAALAGLFILDLALVYNHTRQPSSITTGCITFGMPRTGNRAWAHAFNQFVGYNFRVVHYKDIVPHLPPLTPEGFWHVMTEIWEKGRAGQAAEYLTCSEGDGEDPNCSDSVKIPVPTDHLYYMGVAQDNCANKTANV